MIGNMKEKGNIWVDIYEKVSRTYYNEDYEHAYMEVRDVLKIINSEICSTMII
jgi:hypothetical protein